jgi:ubiquinone/menaquinone biosynthesis C-methylase UbiE
VLEIGSGPGAALAFLAGRFPFDQQPVGLDLSAAALRAGPPVAGRPYALVQGSASRLPFAAESFDLILLAHTLRHLSDEGLMRLLIDAQRVLRPGGVVAAWDFAPRTSRRLNALHRVVLERFGGAGELRGFGRLAHLASEAGYGVIERPHLRPFLFPPIPRTALLARRDD